MPFGGQFDNDAIVYQTMAPSAVFDKLRDAAAGQVVLFNDADLTAFLASVRAERSDGSAAYALAVDGTAKRLQMRNHNDDGWVRLFDLDSTGKYISNRFETLVEVGDDQQVNGGTASEQALPATETTIAANDQTTDTVYRGTFSGYITVGGFGGATWRIRLRHGGTGGTALLDTGNLTDPGNGTYAWQLTFDLAVDVIGASGKAWVQGSFFNGFLSAQRALLNSAVVNYQTDSAKTLGLTVQITGGTSSDVFVVTNGRIERKG